VAEQRKYRKFTAQQKLEIVLAGLKGDRFAALAFFRRVVVAVNMPYCDRCAEGITGGRAPYNSVKGMTTVVRALRLHRR
jgi:hypothetical protein